MSAVLLEEGAINLVGQNNLVPPEVARPPISKDKIELLSAPHYGWCPYDDIDLMGPNGLEHHVVLLPNGEWAPIIRRGQLTLFQNGTLYVPPDEDIDRAVPNLMSNPITNAPSKPPTLVPMTKYAATCCGEIEDSYGRWGFVRLSDLTGKTVAEAFDIFSTVLSAVGSLPQMEHDLVHEAPKRIAARREQDDKFPDATAEFTRREMLIAVRRAKGHAGAIVDELHKDMAAYIGTRVGKSSAFPGDIVALERLEQPVPSNIAPKSDSADLTQIVKLLTEHALRSTTPTMQEQQILDALEAQRRSEARLAAMEEELKQLREGTATVKNDGDDQSLTAEQTNESE